MSNNIDLKGLWGQQQAAGRPDAKELIKKAGKVKKDILRRLVLTNLCLFASVVFIRYIGISNHFALPTTQIGIALVIIAIVVYLTVSTGLLKKVFTTNQAADSITYLNDLLAIRKKQGYIYGILLKIYFVLLTLGLILYLIEFLVRMTLPWAATISMLTLGWVLFVWFYLSPRMVKKQQSALNDIIARLETINKAGFEEN